jgi:sensor domain CHASE-containing protein
MGHNLLKDRNRNREAHAAIATRQLTMAGPFELLQGGGMAAVARMPVFLEDGGESRFWGFAIILVRIPNLLDTAGLGDLARLGYRYEFWRSLPDTEERSVFARHGTAPPQDPAEYSITVPNGLWTLALAPEAGWDDPATRLHLTGLSLLVAACLAGLQIIALQSFLRAIVRLRLEDSAKKD